MRLARRAVGRRLSQTFQMKRAEHEAEAGPEDERPGRRCCRGRRSRLFTRSTKPPRGRRG